MEKAEIIERLERIAGHSVHKTGEKPFIMGLDDGIAVYEAIDIIKALPAEAYAGMSKQSGAHHRGMAVEEVLWQLQDILDDDVGEDFDNNPLTQTPREAIREAIRIINEKQERDTPKPAIQDKRVRYGMDYDYHDWICPTCGKFLAFEPNTKGIPPICSCGQKIRRESEVQDEEG